MKVIQILIETAEDFMGKVACELSCTGGYKTRKSHTGKNRNCSISKVRNICPILGQTQTMRYFS